MSAARLGNGRAHAGDLAHLQVTFGATGDQPPDVPAGLEPPPDLGTHLGASVETWRSRAWTSRERAVFLRERAERRIRRRRIGHVVVAVVVLAVVITALTWPW